MRVRRKPALAEANELQVLEAAVENPYISVRETNRNMDISTHYVHCTLQKYKFHSFKVQLHQYFQSK